MDNIKKGEDIIDAMDILDGEISIPFIVVESLMERHEQEKSRMRKEHEKTMKHMRSIITGTRVTACIIVVSILLATFYICCTYDIQTFDVEQDTFGGGDNVFVGGDLYGPSKNKNDKNYEERE